MSFIVRYSALLLVVASSIITIAGLNAFIAMWSCISCFVILVIASLANDFIGRRKTNIAAILFYSFYFIFILWEPLISICLTGTISYETSFGMVSARTLNVVCLSHAVVLWTSTLFLARYQSPKLPYLGEFNWKSTAVLILFNVLGLFPYLRNGVSGFVKVLLQGRSVGNTQFENVGLGNSDLWIHLSTFLIASAVIAGCTLVANRRKTRTLRVILCAIVLFNVLVVASSGTRTRILLIVVPLFGIFFHFVHLGYRRLQLLPLALVSTGIIALLSVMVQFRSQGFQEIGSGREIELNADGLNLNNEFIYIVDHFPSPVNNRTIFQCWIYPIPEQLWKFLTNPIPRIMYPQKYVDPSFSVFNQMRIGYTGMDQTFNITPTIFGRFYMLYGLPGMIYVGLFMGGMMRLSSNLLYRAKSMEGVIMALSLLAFCCQSFRDLSPGWIYALVATAVVLYTIKLAR